MKLDALPLDGATGVHSIWIRIEFGPKSGCLTQWRMEDLRNSRARKEWGNVAECNRQMGFEILRRLENERLAGIHHLEEQVGHVALFRAPLVLLFSFDHLFGQVTFTLANHDRIVAVYTEIGNDIFLAQLIIEVNQGNNPRFDKHKERKAQGDPLFYRNLQSRKAIYMNYMPRKANARSLR